MSSPFWVVLLAAAYKIGTPLGITPQWYAKGLSATCGFLTAIATYRLTWSLTAPKGAAPSFASRLAAVCAGLLVLFEPNLAYGHWTGMEGSLAGLLNVLAVHAALQRRHLQCGLVLGALVITRGESVPVALVITAVQLADRVHARGGRPWLEREDVAIAGKLLVPPFLLGGLWALYNVHATGRPLPNTYYAKHDPTLGLFDLDNVLAIYRLYFCDLSFVRGGWAFFSGILALGACIRLIQTRRWRQMVLVAGLPVLYWYLTSRTLSFRGAGWFTFWHRRYFDVGLPLVMALFAVGAHELWCMLSAKSRGRPARIAFSLSLTAFVVGMGFWHRRRIWEYSWDTENIEDVTVTMGRWLGQSLPANAVIGVTDAGASRFFSRPSQRIVDFLGLNCAPCSDFSVAQKVEIYRPDYLVFFREGLDPFLGPKGTAMQIKALKPRGLNTMLGGSELVVVKLTSQRPEPAPERVE